MDPIKYSLALIKHFQEPIEELKLMLFNVYALQKQMGMLDYPTEGNDELILLMWGEVTRAVG